MTNNSITKEGLTTEHNLLAPDGRERLYFLHTPPQYQSRGSQPIPLLLVFHGGESQEQKAKTRARFNNLSDQEGFLVAYPTTFPLDAWNNEDVADPVKAVKLALKSDDRGFVRSLVSELRERYSIDEKRIYATGFSNGGQLVELLGCKDPDLFAAIAPVYGVSRLVEYRVIPCNMPGSTSVIEFLILPNKTERKIDRYLTSYWARLNSCSSTPSTEKVTSTDEDIEIFKASWSSCSNGTAVVSYFTFGEEHEWPTKDNSFSSSLLIWEFFKSHPKR